MDPGDILRSITESNSSNLNYKTILDILLPPDNEMYSLSKVDEKINPLRDKIEEVQQHTNNIFDKVLDDKTTTSLRDLYKGLDTMQLDLMKLQCDITFTKEQSDLAYSTCNNPIILERRDIVHKEKHLKESLRQLKFEPIKNFFHKLSQHLQAQMLDVKSSSLHQSSNYQQLFDWSMYHKTINLLRACGRSMQNITTFERLYLSDFEFVKVNFTEPLEHISLNNFIGPSNLQSLDHSIELQISNGELKLFADLQEDDRFKSSLTSDHHLKYVVFQDTIIEFKSITIACCRLLLELQMNYIDAHLTDGVNIDKLNGSENGPVAPPEEQVLPLYAFSPQDYITQIGQHLLTLRKQTELYDSSSDIQSLMFALEQLEEAQDISIEVKSYNTVSEVVMRCIARHCIRSLLGRTNASVLTKLNKNGKRQLATDALYLDNVLEDLKLLDSQEPNVDKFKSLLT